MDTEVIEHAHAIWNYHHMNMEISPAELIFGLGSIDTQTAHRCAQLFKDGYAPLIVFSGGVAHAHDELRTTWEKPEAVIFANEAVKHGVPRSNILIEDKATNTGENITFTYQLLKSKHIDPKSIILVQKPYMERRTYTTFAKQWPDKETTFMVTSPQISFKDYLFNAPTDEQEKIINLMVGDLDRIIEYPKKGFQIEQKVPEEILMAYEKLKEAGFTKHLL